MDKNPTNQFHFLQASTSGIPGAAAVTRWTFWNACSVVNGRNSCPKVHPAYPFDPHKNFGTETGVPKQLIRYARLFRLQSKEYITDTIDSANSYYLMTRFMFAFVLIGGFFGACSLLLGCLALCSRIGSFLSSALCSVALFFQTITAALMT